MTRPSPAPARDHADIAPQMRGSGLIFAASLLAAAIELCSQVILVRELPKPEFGALAFAIALVLFLQTLALFGMPLTVSRYVPLKRETDGPGAVLGVIVTALATVLVLGTACAFGVVVAMAALPDDAVGAQAARLTSILAFLIPLEALVVTLTAAFAAYGRTRAIVIRGSLVAPGLKLAVTASLIVFGTSVGFVAAGYVGASLIGTTLYAWLCVRMLRSEGLLRPSVRRAVRWPVRELLPFASVGLATTLVWACLEMSDAILLGVLRGPAEVAEMRAITPFIRGYAIVIASFLVLFAPLAATYFARRDAVAMQQLYVRTAAWLTVLAFPLLLLTCVFAETLVGGLYGTRYASSAAVLAVLSVGYFAQAASGFNGQLLKIHGHLRYTLAVDGVAVVLNVTLNLLLIPRWGALGAGVGTAATLLVHNALKQGALRRLTGVGLGDAAYLRLLLTAAALTAAAVGIRLAIAPGLAGALAVTMAATLLLLRVAGGVLHVEELFPGIARRAVVRRLLGSGEAA